MERDRATFTMEQIREIESLYRLANRDLRAPSSKEANRAGCALLYLADAVLAKEIEREFAESVDHSGNRLTDTLRKMKLLR